MKSIIQEEKQCYICETTYNLECHHCIHGTANRKLAEKDGLKVWLCVAHHRGDFGVHGKFGSMLDLKLKQTAELVWMTYYGKTEEQFIKRYGKSYI